MSVNGEADGAPLRVGLPVVDMVTGLNAALGVLLALQERAAQRPRPVRRGGAVRLRACRCCTRMAPTGSSTAATPQRTGNAHPNIYPYDSMATAPSRSSWRSATTGSSRSCAGTWARRRWPATSASPRAGARSVNRVALKAELEALARHARRPEAGRRAGGRRRALRAGAVGAARRCSTRTRRTAAWWSRCPAATAASPRRSS